MASRSRRFDSGLLPWTSVTSGRRGESDRNVVLDRLETRTHCRPDWTTKWWLGWGLYNENSGRLAA